MWKVSLYYSQNSQNYAALSHGNFLRRYQKLSDYSRQRKRRKCEHFSSKDKCLECLPSPFT